MGSVLPGRVGRETAGAVYKPTIADDKNAATPSAYISPSFSYFYFSLPK